MLSRLNGKKIIILVFLFSLIIRLRFLSPWLEDWDSVQFALALHHFDISTNLPHAPGYILYIGLAKILYFFTRSDVFSLALLSVLTGSFSIIMVFLIAKKMFGEKVATIASILFAISPISLMMSVAPLTNMPGQFSLLIFLYLIYSRPKKIFFVSVVGGLILGMRATEAPIVFAVLALTYLPKSFKKFFLSLFYFSLGVSLWLIPTIVISGFSGFASSYRWIAAYILAHDSVANMSLFSRIPKIYYLLNVGYSFPFILISLFSLIFIILKRNIFRKREIRFILVWLLSYLIPLVFIYNLEVPRYTLPLSVPMAILSAYAIIHFARRINHFIFYGFMSLIAFAVFKQGISQLNLSFLLTPPEISAVQYVEKSFDPKQTTILSSFTFRHFQYYAPTFKNYLSGEKNTTTMANSEYLIIDYLGIKDKIENINEYKLVDQKTFEGPKEIFPRVNRTNLYIYKKYHRPSQRIS